MAQWARRRLEQLFTDAHGAALDVLAEVRAEVQQARGTSEVDGWTDALDDHFFDLVAAGELDAARDQLRRALGVDGEHDPTHQEVPS